MSRAALRPRCQVEPGGARALAGRGTARHPDTYRAPNANAYAERFVRSIKEECLNRLIPLGERHHRRAVAEFVAHYHRERNHQGLANELLSLSVR
jgi:transposase InsO family protein